MRARTANELTFPFRTEEEAKEEEEEGGKGKGGVSKEFKGSFFYSTEVLQCCFNF